MEEQLIKVSEHYHARRRGSDRFTAIDIGQLSEKGTLFADIHVTARVEWTHESNYEKEEWTPATVNWPSIGSQNAKITKEFATVLLWAAKEAAKMDRKHKVQPK